MHNSEVPMVFYWIMSPSGTSIITSRYRFRLPGEKRSRLSCHGRCWHCFFGGRRPCWRLWWNAKRRVPGRVTRPRVKPFPDYTQCN